MSTPLTDATPAAPTAAPTNHLTPRQRLENALAHLPAPAGSLVAQKDADSSSFPSTRYNALVEPVQRINEVMRNYGVEFHLQEFEQGQRVVTRIIDRESGETIRQIPSEEVLKIAESLEQMQGRLIQLQV